MLRQLDQGCAPGIGIRFVGFCSAVMLLLSVTSFAWAQNPVARRAWQEIYSSTKMDQAYSVALDHNGGIYAGGWTMGQLGSVEYGSRDAFLAKLLPDGSRVWDIQYGTPYDDAAYGLAHGPDGSIYVAGMTEGSMHGETHLGNHDVFVVKYDGNGQRLWTRQFGSTRADSVWEVTTDAAGNCFVVGSRQQADNSWDTFVTKLSAAGSELWTWESGINRSDYGFDVSVDVLGNIFVAGAGFPGPGYSDIYVTKLNSGGSAEWTKVFDVYQGDRANAVAADGLGNVYVSGATHNDANGFLWKMDGQGNRLWTAAVDGQGWGLWGDANKVAVVGTYDRKYVSITGYDGLGNYLWNEIEDSGFTSIAPRALDYDDEYGFVVAGYTVGTGPNGWGRDFFVERYELVPGPSSAALLMLGLLAIRRRRRWACFLCSGFALLRPHSV